VKYTVAFCKRVYPGDHECVISKGVPTASEVGLCDGFEAAHVFPPSHHQIWIDKGFDGLISVKLKSGEAMINSVKNAVLLRDVTNHA